MAAQLDRVTVAASSPYEVVVGQGLSLAELTAPLRPGPGPHPAVLFTDSNVGAAHAAVERELSAAGWRVVEVVEVLAGERSKSFDSYASAVRRLAAAGVTRDATLFALGGGVVGDLGGFVAHSYMRGLRLVQLPTSLLAMVDSSVGGKVGIDLPEGKNLVGGFLQPELVVADTARLATLPPRQLSCGLAEVVKMGLLAGGEYYRDLALVDRALERDPEALRRLVLHAVRFKASVVERDEREGGLRAVLNYGHTIGHGLEAAAGYDLLHGEAISLGMLAAAELSFRRYGPDFHKDFREEQRSLLAAAGLPTELPAGAIAFESERVLAAMRRDKKRRGGEHRFVLLRGAGEPEWDVPVGEEEIREVLRGVLR